MDMQSVLEASFPAPTLEPDWQSELLAQLGAMPATSVNGHGARPVPAPRQVQLHIPLRAVGFS